MKQQETLQQKLQTAMDGLLYPSESDEPFEYVCWPAAGKTTPNTQSLLNLLDLTLDTPVRTQSIDDFFAELTEAQDWWGEQEQADACKYRALRQILTEQLQSPMIFRVGEVEIDVYLVGRFKADLVGLRTRSVET